jgi:hypothetical protein
MTRTPAAELARVKREFPVWTIRPVEPGKGTGFTAQRRAAAGLRSIYGTSAMVGERQVARRACRAQPVPLVRWRVSGISGAHSANHGPSGVGRTGPGFRSDPDRRSCAGQCLPRTARFAASELRRLNLPVTAWFKSVADRGACGPGGPGWW